VEAKVRRERRARPGINQTDASVGYRKLRDMILRTELRPGEALKEADLIRRIKIGRTPLRDALHFLAHEGLVEILPRRGTFVTKVTVSDLQQIFEVRSGIEDIVARAATARPTDADLRELESLISRAKRATHAESDVELDTAFHSLLLRIAGNRYLADMYQRLGDASLRLLYLTRCGMEPRDAQLRFFEDAEQALKAGDSATLSEVLRDHVRAFRDRVSGSLFFDQDARSYPAPVLTGRR
jgi:DNA-binding GntR family transcriptional regulator